MTTPKSNCLRPDFAYLPRKIGFGEVKFALVLVVRVSVRVRQNIVIVIKSGFPTKVGPSGEEFKS